MITDADAIQIEGPAEEGEGRQYMETMQRLHKSRVRSGRRKSDSKESGIIGYANQGPAEGVDARQQRKRMQCLYRSMVRRGRRMATVKRGCWGYPDLGLAQGGHGRQQRERTQAEVMQTKGPQREENGNNKEIGCRS